MALDAISTEQRRLLKLTDQKSLQAVLVRQDQAMTRGMTLSAGRSDLADMDRVLAGLRRDGLHRGLRRALPALWITLANLVGLRVGTGGTRHPEPRPLSPEMRRLTLERLPRRIDRLVESGELDAWDARMLLPDLLGVPLPEIARRLGVSKYHVRLSCLRGRRPLLLFVLPEDLRSWRDELGGPDGRHDSDEPSDDERGEAREADR